MVLEQNANFMEYVSNFEFAWVKGRKPHFNLNSNYINRSLWLVQVCMRQKYKTQETSLYFYPGCFIHKQPNYELKHRYQLRGMASTLPMRTSTSPRQWKPWTAVSPLLGWSAWHSRRVNNRAKPAYQRPFTAEASAKHSFKWASVHNLVVSFSYWEG